MKMGNYTAVTEFLLVGLSQYPELQHFLFVLCLIMYKIILLGNSLLIIITILDPRLHTPMYFFLGNLSFLDICYTSSSIPSVLIIFMSERISISFLSCTLQMFFTLGLGSTECVLLAVMAYDRYVAICNPLRYPIIMNKVLYSSILKINSAEGRKKAFSTCSAHLTVVILFYGSALFMYTKPKSNNTKVSDEIIGLSYGVITPMLNPIIYSLRNKEVKEAVKKILNRYLHLTKV
uniref:olfactory receptor 2S2-like n=1 Tax=Ictidomys tridecemlineatus TaxID=43179 RepID=UPI001A9E0E6C|nr:olfactory receptor 2S2-like [Ictidomys tridecemlineatus]